MTPILILAAGQSKRMRGRDKLLEIVHDRPLLQLQAVRALATKQPVYMALPVDSPQRLACLAGLNVIEVPVAAAAEGIGVSLRTGIAALPDCDAFLLMLADLPEIETDDLNAVLAARRATPNARIWRGATAGGKPGHPILIDASLRPAFASLSGDQGGSSVLRTYAEKTHLVQLPGARARLDLDTPEDWAAWRAKAGLPK